jgi:hypothetical protein
MNPDILPILIELLNKGQSDNQQAITQPQPDASTNQGTMPNPFVPKTSGMLSGLPYGGMLSKGPYAGGMLG